ncbi:MAG: hypothetical protein ABSE51_12020 [Terracidiphilus sp.]
MFLLLIAFSTSSQVMSSPPSDADRLIAGEGIIDRVIAAGSEPVFRAGGYTLRITPATEVRFGKGLQAMSEVGTNTFAIFKGQPDTSGAIVATRAIFARLKLPKGEPDPNAVQVTTFRPGGVIDAGLGFGAGPKSFPQENHGGWCGWYDVPADSVAQEHIRRLGTKVVPQYQRDLPADDPAKIPFRFYVVEDDYIRSEIFCDNGLVLVPATVVSRLHNDDQIAAVLADGIAGELQLQATDARGFTFTPTEDAELMAAGLVAFAFPIASGTAGLVIHSQVARAMEHERGRIALVFLTDAGFDPRQAPEAWRLLAPHSPPKNPAKLKYPERSLYLKSILESQNTTASGAAAPQADQTATVTPGSSNAAPGR